MGATRFAITALSLWLAGCAAKADGGAAASVVPPALNAAPGAIRAQAGDTIYLVEHFVRADRRQQFEEFVETVLWPAFERAAAANPARGRMLRQTRMLLPLTPNDDGTFTYTFVLDPVVAGESYTVLEILREANGDEAAQHYTRFTETWARDFTSRPFVLGRAASTK